MAVAGPPANRPPRNDQPARPCNDRPPQRRVRPTLPLRPKQLVLPRQSRRAISVNPGRDKSLVVHDLSS